MAGGETQVRLTAAEKETVQRCIGKCSRERLVPAIREWLSRHNVPLRPGAAWDRARLVNVACKAVGMKKWETAPFEPAFLFDCRCSIRRCKGGGR